MSYHDNLTAISEQAATDVTTVYEQFLDGTIEAAAAVATIAAIVATANAKAAAVADLALAADLTLALGEPITALGIGRPADDLQRLAKAARTLLLDLPEQITVRSSTALTLAVDEPVVPVERVARLGRVEPLTAAGQAYDDAVARNPRVTGYRRGLSATACELCTWLAKRHLDPAGYVYPADKPMHRHKGCTCYPVPVTTERSTTA